MYLSPNHSNAGQGTLHCIVHCNCVVLLNSRSVSVPITPTLARVTVYGLLTKCEVKMAGYWPSSFFVRLWTETKLRSINSQKKERGFIIWLLEKFCLRDTAGSPERARWLHLARSGSQSQRAIWFILPARGTICSHIISCVIEQDTTVTVSVPITPSLARVLCCVIEQDTWLSQCHCQSLSLHP